MKYRVIIQPPARADIEAAYLYLRDRSEDAAERWLSGLEEAIESLNQLPERFALAPESGEFPEHIRQLIYGRRRGRYRILYLVRENKVHVLHIRHGARRPLRPDEL
jgi:plasmid stabilization system protein ParE